MPTLFHFSKSSSQDAPTVRIEIVVDICPLDARLISITYFGGKLPKFFSHDAKNGQANTQIGTARFMRFGFDYTDAYDEIIMMLHRAYFILHRYMISFITPASTPMGGWSILMSIVCLSVCLSVSGITTSARHQILRMFTPVLLVK